MPKDVILFGASLSADKAQPMKYLSGVLANWHEKNVGTVDQAKNFANPQSEERKVDGKIKTRNYSKQDLNALFDSLEEVEI